MKRKQQKLGKNKHQRGKWYEIKPRKNANEPLYTIQDKKKKRRENIASSKATIV
jgi:hypothetical protein